MLHPADVLVHGYRPGALDNLGYDIETRRKLAPNLIDVTLNAYGWTGPWATRRGFDSLVQMSSGIAEAGQHWASSDHPTPLPVQALDHAAGYLMAAAVLSALTTAAQGEPVAQARLSLARTAALLGQLRKTTNGPDITKSDDSDYNTSPEQSGWGSGQRLLPPLQLASTQMQWDLPAQQCGGDSSTWSK